MKRMTLIGAVALGVTLVWACSSAVEEFVLTPDASADDERPAQPKTIEVECENRWYREHTNETSVYRVEHWYAEIELDALPERGISAFVCGRIQQHDFEVDEACPEQEGSECETNLDSINGLHPLDCVSTAVTFDNSKARVACGKSAYMDGEPAISDLFRFRYATFIIH